MKLFNKILLLFFIGVVYSLPASCFDYYFSQDGDDHKNNGLTMESPFKSIGKLNSLDLFRGDRVFFKRGDRFEGQINIRYSGTSASYIHLDAYGTGAAPVIAGSIKVKNWSNYTDNIYVTTLDSIPEISNLILNNTFLTLARYPNAGYLKIEQATQNTVSSQALQQSTSYWAGANLIVKTQRWIIEKKLISSSSGSTVVTSTSSNYPIKKEWGFFINNSLQQLDSAGEWYFDKLERKLYLWPPDNQNPENLDIEASIVVNGINIDNVRYTRIKNLTLTGQRADAIYMEGSSFIEIENCTFINIGRNGIYSNSPNGNSILVNNNSFKNIANNGIDLAHSSNCIITTNLLTNIGMVEGSGESGDGQYLAIHSGVASYVAFNKIDSVGYIGINGSNNDTIENNIISNYCLIKDDGGGIYCYKSREIFCKNNIIKNGIGNGAGTDNPISTFAIGIYLDDSTTSCNLQNNTIENSDYGIFLHNTINCQVLQNKTFNNSISGLCIQNDEKVDNSVNITGNVIKENILYSLNPDQLSLYLVTNKNNLNQLASFDNNHYWNPYNKIIIRTSYVPEYPQNQIPKISVYDLKNWKEEFLQDQSSKTTEGEFQPYYNVVDQFSNLILNPDFNTGISRWNSWQGSNNKILWDRQNNAFNGGSLRSYYSGISNLLIGNFTYCCVPLEGEKYYQLNFKGMSEKPATLDFDITISDYPYYSHFITKHGSRLTPSVTDFTTIFKSNFTGLSNQLIFSTTKYDSTIWIDDVILKEVQVDTLLSQPRQNSILLTNHSTTTKVFNLEHPYSNVYGKFFCDKIAIPPFSSEILIKKKECVTIGFNFQQKNGGDSHITIHPNPCSTNSTLYVSNTRNKLISSIEILNIYGKTLLEKKINDNAEIIQIDLNVQLIPGNYFIKITSTDFIETKKIIVK